MASRIASPVFVGRGEELQRLQAVLEGAGSGIVGTVIVGGEAGVGKTRLLAELRAGAESAGLRFLVGACVDLGDGARPYDPLVAALRPWLKGLSAEEFSRIVGPARSAVQQLIPDLETGSDGKTAVDTDMSSTQSTLYLQVLGLIERVATDAVTVIVLEDLHWSDRSTRDMLRFLVRNLTHGRVVLIGTYRTDELNERHPFLTLLAELGRSGQVERIELDPFTRSEVHDQLAGILGSPPDRALVTRLHERGGGNAFFIEELLVVEQRGEQRLGLTLRETLLARIRRPLDRIATPPARGRRGRSIRETRRPGDRHPHGARRDGPGPARSDRPVPAGGRRRRGHAVPPRSRARSGLRRAPAR